MCRLCSAFCLFPLLAEARLTRPCLEAVVWCVVCWTFIKWINHAREEVDSTSLILSLYFHLKSRHFSVLVCDHIEFDDSLVVAWKKHFLRCHWPSPSSSSSSLSLVVVSCLFDDSITSSIIEQSSRSRKMRLIGGEITGEEFMGGKRAANSGFGVEIILIVIQVVAERVLSFRKKMWRKKTIRMAYNLSHEELENLLFIQSTIISQWRPDLDRSEQRKKQTNESKCVLGQVQEVK